MGETVKKSKYEIDPPASSSKYAIEPPSKPTVPIMSAEPELHLSDMFSNPTKFSKAINSKFYNVANKGTNLIPAAGGIGGGMLGVEGGPPGMVAGAAIGGAGGEALRQLTRRAIFPPSQGWTGSTPSNSLDAADQIGTEGIKQGAYEAGGQLLRAGSRFLAPKLADAAAAPGKRLLKEQNLWPDDADIGKTILNKSTAIRPRKVVEQLENHLANEDAAQTSVLENARRSGTKLPLAPTRKVASDELAVATEKNSPSYLKDVQSVNDQLANQYGPNGKAIAPLPDFVDPVRARALRQGIDTEIGSWSTGQDAIKPLQKRVYGSLTGEIHSAVPDSVAHDAAMSELIPARDAMKNSAMNTSLPMRIVKRVANPTGGLLPMAIGAGGGAATGGPLGAIVGAASGLAAPEILSSPEVLMTGARALQNQIPAKAFRAVPIGEGLLTKPNAKKLKDQGPDDEE